MVFYVGAKGVTLEGETETGYNTLNQESPSGYDEDEVVATNSMLTRCIHNQHDTVIPPSPSLSEPSLTVKNTSGGSLLSKRSYRQNGTYSAVQVARVFGYSSASFPASSSETRNPRTFSLPLLAPGVYIFDMVVQYGFAIGNPGWIGWVALGDAPTTGGWYSYDQHSFGNSAIGSNSRAINGTGIFANTRMKVEFYVGSESSTTPSRPLYLQAGAYYADSGDYYIQSRAVLYCHQYG